MEKYSIKLFLETGEVFKKINKHEEINIQNPFIERNKKSNLKSRIQKSLYEKRYNFNKSLSIMKNNLPESIKSPNIERYSKLLSSMRSTFTNDFPDEPMINFTPKPFTENEI